MRHFATLFDSAYIPQGLALYESLKKSGGPFTLYVLAMDDECKRLMDDLSLPHVLTFARDSIDTDLGLEWTDRTWQERCWGMASQFCEWLVLVVGGLPEITYIDADCYVWSSLDPVFTEIGDRSVAITPHRLIPAKKYLEATSGTYNVGLIHFKNTPQGRTCLEWWANRVRYRCSAKSGGDQKYLDDFVPRFGRHICVMENIGVNAGPWSIGNWTVTDGPRLDGQPLVTFHYHEYKHGVRLTNYALRESDKELIYKPYSAAIDAAIASLSRHTPEHTSLSDSRC